MGPITPAARAPAREAAPGLCWFGVDMYPSRRIKPDPLDILWHYALGYMPDFVNRRNGAVGWCRWSHRGVQFLDKFEIPRRQKQYVCSPRFELRLDQSFEQVVRACADTGRHVIKDGFGDTWLTEELIVGLLRLHRLGYAHSYETWQDGQLVGGTFGLHLGAFVTLGSMFHRVSNASKAAVGRAMMHLRQRGFEMVDIGMVPTHHVDFGSEWLPRWKFEALLPGLIGQQRSINQDRPAPPVPWTIRLGVPVVRALRAVRRRIPGHAA